MKQLSFTMLLLMLISCSFAQTQLEMNMQAKEEFLKADKELNKVYQQILSDYKSDLAFIKNLKAAQKLWVKFRDAEVAMRYPERPAGHYGTMLPLCYSGFKTQLTNDRIKTLRQWLDGIEGDDCGGSINPKH